jgi:hypothetical protein
MKIVITASSPDTDAHHIFALLQRAGLQSPLPAARGKKDTVAFAELSLEANRKSYLLNISNDVVSEHIQLSSN